MKDSLIDEKVIDFRTMRPVLKKPVIPDYAGGCEHHGFILDEEAGTVECGKCHKILDPFFCLLMLCKSLDIHDYRLDEFKKYSEHRAAEREKEKVRYARMQKKIEKTSQT